MHNVAQLFAGSQSLRPDVSRETLESLLPEIFPYPTNLPSPEPREGLSAPSDPSTLDTKSTSAAATTGAAVLDDPEVPKCIIGWLLDTNGDRVRALPCRRIRCERCGPRKARQLAKRLRDCGVVLDRMITVTFPAGTSETIAETVMRARGVFHRFITALTKKYRDLLYFKVIEVGKKRGMVHFHLAVNRYVPWQVVRALWVRSGGGRIIAVDRIGVSYALKYLVKFHAVPSNVALALRRTRLWSHSQKLMAPMPKLASGIVWCFVSLRSAPWNWPETHGCPTHMGVGPTHTPVGDACFT